MNNKKAIINLKIKRKEEEGQELRQSRPTQLDDKTEEGRKCISLFGICIYNELKKFFNILNNNIIKAGETLKINLKASDKAARKSRTPETDFRRKKNFPQYPGHKSLP